MYLPTYRQLRYEALMLIVLAAMESYAVERALQLRRSCFLDPR